MLKKRSKVQKRLAKVVMAALLCTNAAQAVWVPAVAEATEMTGISRSSYYKYKDDIFPYHEEKAAGTKVTMLITLDDEPGLLSKVLKTVADFGGNILTINQSIPVRGIAALTISFEVYPTSGEVNSLAAAIDETEGIHYVKILTQ